MEENLNRGSGATEGAGGGIRFVATGLLEQFRVDEAAFAQWMSECDSDDRPEPPLRCDDRPAAALASLVADAVDAKAIVGDDRLELMVHSDDDCYGSGLYILVRNADAERDLLSVTGGWQEMWLNDDAGLDEVGRVLDYLAVVCAEGNRVLAGLEPG